MSADTLIALVYRVGKGCRQYPFYDLESLKKFCSRKTYCNDYLRVQLVYNLRIVGEKVVHASLAPGYVESGGSDK